MKVGILFLMGFMTPPCFAQVSPAYTQTLKEVRYILKKAKAPTAPDKIAFFKNFATLPDVIVMPALELRELALSLGVSNAGTFVRVLYFPFIGEGRLFVSDDLNVEGNACDRSFLAHELVHHLQYRFIKQFSPDSFSRGAALGPAETNLGRTPKFESEAYEIQDQWMSENKGSESGRIATYSLSGIVGVNCQANP